MPHDDAWTEADFAGVELLGWDRMIRAELVPGERLVWEGRPRPGQLAWSTSGFVVFGLIWEGFSVFALTQALRRSEAFAPFLVMPFLLVGMVPMLSPVWFAWKASRTCYAITDRRVIVCEPRFGSTIRIRSFGPESLTNLLRDQRGDGSGSLIFEELQPPGDDGNQIISGRGFNAISNVQRVESLFRFTLLDDWNRS